jgi:hypothetical protein
MLSMGLNDRQLLVEAAERVQLLPYSWPGPPDATSARDTGRGTCAAKHALLREFLLKAGLRSSRILVVGPLAPDLWPDLQTKAGGLMEVHECLTVETEWAGPLLVDVTWQPVAVAAGLPGTLNWDGRSDMVCAVNPVASYAVADEYFRDQKERLRARLYTSDQRLLRDTILAEIAHRADGLTRNPATPPQPDLSDHLSTY